LSEGNLYITGREKDVIIRGGRNISPYELEEAVGGLAGIRRGCVAVFGSMDAASGTERVVVLAETREADLSRHIELKRKINELAVSLIGAPVDDIMLAPPQTVPKTSSGKIRRLAARDYYERGPSAVKSQAVWWQFVRLAVGSVLPQLRRGWRVARGLLFAAYAWLLFGALFIVILAAAAISPGKRTWQVAQRCARLFFSALPHPAGGARPGKSAAFRRRGDCVEPHQLPRRRSAARHPAVAQQRVRRQARAARGLHHAHFGRRGWRASPSTLRRARDEALAQLALGDERVVAPRQDGEQHCAVEVAGVVRRNHHGAGRRQIFLAAHRQRDAAKPKKKPRAALCDLPGPLAG